MLYWNILPSGTRVPLSESTPKGTRRRHILSKVVKSATQGCTEISLAACVASTLAGLLTRLVGGQARVVMTPVQIQDKILRSQCAGYPTSNMPITRRMTMFRLSGAYTG